MKEENIEQIVLTLSPIEKKVLQVAAQGMEEIKKRTQLDETSIIRALHFLESKKLIELKVKRQRTVELDVNGILYKKANLPERKLLNVLIEKNKLELQEAKKLAGLSDNEFMIALGVLKEKNFAKVQAEKIELQAKPNEITKKLPEERFLDELPIALESLTEEQKWLFEKLKARKKIVKIAETQEFEIKLNELGARVLEELMKFKEELIEQLTPEMIEKKKWQGKKFRRYDILSKAPNIYGGKRHFVNQAIDYARAIWLELGFEEISGSLVQTAFWNFDALFTPQDHPAREMHDTFYLKDIKGKLPKQKGLVLRVKKAHEAGIKGSKGWQYLWNENEAKKVILRTHTTCLSAHALATFNLKNKKGKYFAIGRCFRNETVDWAHAFEFNQTEGIVIDVNANFRHLLGYLKEFYAKMGFKNIRFRPSYFPYTEPSLEIDVFVPEKKEWLELGGAGILRPEVVVPLIGEWVPVLAWGPGFDRMITYYYQIKDLRELYANNLNVLRKIQFWMK